ncbi:MAG: hypothetical protein ABIO93_17940 [Dyadobacter sp.]|uniref:hypothetical protein n=1 Tax=Dyadobacter sp. TaxID=1914288 RepID=UPI0032667681
MRHFLITLLFFMALAKLAKAQVINWRSFEAQQRMATLNAGLDYGLTYGAAYAHRLNTRVPIALTMDASIPSGHKLLDDFKVRMGLQVEVLRVGNLSATLKVNGVFRRFENPGARLLNFGGEFGGIVGYCKPGWFIAGEAGFDKAIVTHVQHAASVVDQTAGLRSGWYIPTGGNFQYGLQGGVSLRKTDLTLRAGRLLQQDFKTSPLLPLYAQLGINRRF